MLSTTCLFQLHLLCILIMSKKWFDLAALVEILYFVKQLCINQWVTENYSLGI